MIARSTASHSTLCMDVMDEEAEATGFMGAEADDFSEESESDELLLVPLSQEEQLVRRLSEVDRCGTKIAVELDKDNPCKGVVSRELLELELGALTRDRASIERKLRLLPSESQDDIVIDAPRYFFHQDPDAPIPTTESTHFNAPFSRRATSRATEQQEHEEDTRRRWAPVSEPAASGNFAESGAFSVAFIDSRGPGPTAQQSPFAALGRWESASGARGASGACGGSTMSTDSNDETAGGLGMAVSSAINEVSRFQHMTAGRPTQEDFERHATEKTRRFWSPPPFAYGPSSASVANRAPVGVVGGGGGGGEVTPPSSPWMAPKWADDDTRSRQPDGSPELHCTSSRQPSGSDHQQQQQQQQWINASFSLAPEIGGGGGGGVGYRRGTMIPVAREPSPAVSYDRHVGKRSRYYSSPPSEGRMRPFREGMNRASNWQERRRIADGGDDGPRAWASHIPMSTLSSSDLHNTAPHYDGDHCLTPQQEVSYPPPWGKGNAHRHDNTNSGSARWGEGDRAHDDYESVRRDFRSLAPFSEPVSGPVSASFSKRRSFRIMDQPEFSFSDGWSGGWGGSEGAHYDVRRAAAGTAPAAIAINALHEGVGGGGFGSRSKHGREIEAAWGGRHSVARDASLAGHGGGLVEQMGRGGCDTPTAPTMTY